MPHALKLPWVWLALIKLVCTWHSVIDKFVTDRLPRFPAIVRSLNHLTEPTAALRCIQPVGICRSPFQVINFPAPKMWPTDIPLLAFSIRSKRERAFPRCHQNSHSAHVVLPGLLSTDTFEILNNFSTFCQITC